MVVIPFLFFYLPRYSLCGIMKHRCYRKEEPVLLERKIGVIGRKNRCYGKEEPVLLERRWG